MQLDQEFAVPVPVAQAWPVLLDVERIAPCMPGASVTKVDGQNIEGKVKVKVGPIVVSYAGTATFLEVDEVGRRVVIEARGKETRGSGTASATVTARLYDEGDRTRVTVNTDLAVTGKPAQFGRGVMADVSAKLLGQFSECLSRKLTAGDEPAADTNPDGSSTAAPATPSAAAPGAASTAASATDQEAGASSGSAASRSGAPAAVLDTAAGRPAGQVGAAREPEVDDAIDLLGTAGLPILKRAAPVLAGLIGLAVLFAILRRHRD